jgi:hypothetical protein
MHTRPTENIFSGMNILAILLLNSVTMALIVCAAAMAAFSNTMASAVRAKRDIQQQCAGIGWQIELDHPLTDFSLDFPVY